jgi:hypothetical protein
MKKLNLDSLTPTRNNTIVSFDINKFYVHIADVQVLATLNASDVFKFFNLQNIDIKTKVKFTNLAGNMLFNN